MYNYSAKHNVLFIHIPKNAGTSMNKVLEIEPKKTKHYPLSVLQAYTPEPIFDNAIKIANTPNYNFLKKNFPSSFLKASGNFVGLPKNQIGNSEVGHMNIGSGRVILQSLPKIDKAFEEGYISKNSRLNDFFKKHNSEKSIHILGLCSYGGVHSHAKHIIEMSKIICKKFNNVKLHLFSDGRDTLPKEFGTISKKFVLKFSNLNNQLGKKVTEMIITMETIEKKNNFFLIITYKR